MQLKYGKLATKYRWIYGYFLQCIGLPVNGARLVAYAIED